MVNYKNGKIYKLVSDQNDKIYIGSTVERYLSNRLAGHITNFKTWLNGKGNYITSFELLVLDDVRIELIESYPCDNKDQLRAREQHWINIHKNDCLNERNAIGLDKERQKQYMKQYVKSENFMLSQKKYCQNNKEKIKKYKEKYYQKNKEKIQEYQAKL